MAIVESTGSTLLPKIINVGSAVGPGGTNQVDDVKLVQLMLKEIFASPNWRQFLSARPLTGHCDDLTVAWIWLFQCCMRALSGNCVTDKRVDHAKGFTGPVQHQPFTIVHLNHQFSQANPTKFKQLIGL